MAPKLKYSVSGDENEADILPNHQRHSTSEEINKSEFEGFLRAETFLLEGLTAYTRFDFKYIMEMHELALTHLYSFAGKLRTVNISKDGFMFPMARYLPQAMHEFETEILERLPNFYISEEELLIDIAKVHAEILFIHPFREGNGRTARLLANLMSYKAGHQRLKFEKLAEERNFRLYVNAVQRAGVKDYSYMEKIIKYIF